jgi:hypothetical protein
LIDPGHKNRGEKNFTHRRNQRQRRELRPACWDAHNHLAASASLPESAGAVFM